MAKKSHPKRASKRKPAARPDKKRLTVEQFAKIVGASVQAVELWRSKGMPVTVEKPTGRAGRPRLQIDLAIATDWMLANHVGGFGHAKIEQGANVPNPPITDTSSISDEPGLAGAVQRVYAAERFSFHLLRDAIDSRNNFSIAATFENWREAAKTLADLEKRLTHRAQIEQEIHEQTQQAVREWCEPKRAFIDSIQHAFVSRLLNLRKSAAVEAVLGELVASLLQQLSEPLKINTDSHEPGPH